MNYITKFSIGDKVVVDKDNRPADIQILCDWETTVWIVRFVEDDRYMLIGVGEGRDRRVLQEHYLLKDNHES